MKKGSRMSDQEKLAMSKTVSESLQKKYAAGYVKKKATPWSSASRKNQSEKRKALYDSGKLVPKSLSPESQKKRRETIEKRRASDPNYWNQKGSNNPMWKGGLSKEGYGFEFNNELKLAVKTRDQFCCRLCGRGEIWSRLGLSIHHIDYNKKNNSIDNLLSLCRRCHSKTNHRREYWIAYFTRSTKGFYSFPDIDSLAKSLADKIIERSYGCNFLTFVKGGLPTSAMIMSHLPWTPTLEGINIRDERASIVVPEPWVVIDDILDSGKTMDIFFKTRRINSRTRQCYFLFDKPGEHRVFTPSNYVASTTVSELTWVVFPWEQISSNDKS